MKSLTLVHFGRLAFVLFLSCSRIAIAQSVTISLGGAQQTGDRVVVPINLVSSEGAQPAALEWSLGYSSEVTGFALTAGPETSSANKSLTCDATTCLIYGINADVISDGPIATLTLQTSPHSSFLSIPIQLGGAVAASPSGDAIAANAISGSVLLAPTPPSVGTTTDSTLQTTLAATGNSVSPSGSGGMTQTFSFVFSNGQTPLDFARAEVLIGASTVAADSCLIEYDLSAGNISLASDDLASTESKPAGSSSTIENGQCAIDATSASVTPLTTTVTAGITFKSTFSGRKNIYMNMGTSAGDAIVQPAWEKTGTYTVADPPPPLPAAESVSPDAGHGVSQTFAFVFSDSQDPSNLVAAAILFAPSLDMHNSCYIVFDRKLGTVELERDNAMGGDAKAVNSPLPLENSQCAIGTASVATTGRSTIIGLDITFKSGFTGVKNVYMYGANGDGSINTGWVKKGTWTLY